MHGCEHGGGFEFFGARGFGERSGESPACRVSMDQDTAWRLLTKGLRHEQAVAGVEFGGDQALGQPILGMLAIMG